MREVRPTVLVWFAVVCCWCCCYSRKHPVRVRYVRPSVLVWVPAVLVIFLSVLGSSVYISNAWNPSIHRLIFVRLASRAFHRYPSEHSLNLVVVKALLRDILQNILGILSVL